MRRFLYNLRWPKHNGAAGASSVIPVRDQIGLSGRYGNWVLAPLSPAPSLFPIVLACAALWRRRPDRAARSMRALCLSKFSKGVREISPVIKKDAAISVGRNEIPCVRPGVSEP